jgi:hypothetical protein
MSECTRVPLEQLLKSKTFCKMMFLYNSLEDDWIITRKQDYYMLRKKHENKKEYFDDNYTTVFMRNNFEWRDILEKLASEIKNN